VLLAQPLENPLRGVPLFCWSLFVFLQNGVDDAHPRPQFGLLDWLLTLVPGGTAYRSIFCTVVLERPNSRATAR
jgi:hypothetical protein